MWIKIPLSKNYFIQFITVEQKIQIFQIDDETLKPNDCGLVHDPIRDSVLLLTKFHLWTTPYLLFLSKTYTRNLQKPKHKKIQFIEYIDDKHYTGQQN